MRRDTILRRGATPAVVARLERLEVGRARVPLRLAAAPELDMGARVCFPLRDRGRAAGYAWVLDDPPLAEAELPVLAVELGPVATAVGALLDGDDRRSAAEQAALEALLRGQEPAAAAALLAETGRVRVLAAAQGTDLADVRRRAGSGRVLTGAVGERMVAVVVGDGPVGATAGSLGLGDPVASLAQAPDSHRRALLALAVVTAVPRLGPVATYRALGPYALLAPLAFAAAPPPVPAALVLLREHAEGAELEATLRAVLDAGDDHVRAAESLHVHRSTLHRRLARIARLTGADLADGSVRLELHAALVVAELRDGAARTR